MLRCTSLPVGAVCKTSTLISRLSNSDAPASCLEPFNKPACQNMTTREWDSKSIYFYVVPSQLQVANDWKLPENLWWHLSHRAAHHKLTFLFLFYFFCFASFVLVDELFKEANIRLNGNVNHEEFTQMVVLPPVDYWVPDWRARRDGGVFSLWASLCVCARAFSWHQVIHPLKFQWAFLSNFSLQQDKPLCGSHLLTGHSLSQLSH